VDRTLFSFTHCIVIVHKIDFDDKWVPILEVPRLNDGGFYFLGYSLCGSVGKDYHVCGHKFKSRLKFSNFPHHL